MEQLNKPTIAQRLEYLKVCDVAIEYYRQQGNKNFELSGKYGTNTPEYIEGQRGLFAANQTIKYYNMLKQNIAGDLVKDPEFLKYSAYLMPEETLQIESMRDPDSQKSSRGM